MSNAGAAQDDIPVDEASAVAEEAHKAAEQGDQTQAADDAQDTEQAQADGSADLDALQTENAALKDQLLRSQAELQNVRRRAEKDKADASAYAATSFARDMLVVLDNVRRAMDAKPEDVPAEFTALIEGFDLTARELVNTFSRHGIEEVSPAQGDKFDPKFHQAMFEVPTDQQAPGTVVQVVNAGFKIKERLLRAAMVGVAKAADGGAGVDTKA